MFAKPTVFVIGAGASAEFGLPIGSVLKERVAKALAFTFDFGVLQAGDQRIFKLLRPRDHQELQTFIEAGVELSGAMDTFYSVDEALHFFSAKPEVVQLGKITIANEILKAERKSLLYDRDLPQNAMVEKCNGTWAAAVLSMALSTLKKEQTKTAFQNVTVINFNYDRTLEHYLYVALQRNAFLSPDEAIRSLQELTTLRPYGSLGPLDWQEGKSAPFATQSDDLFSIAEGIRTYTEQHHDQTILGRITSALRQAELVIFLGFGFDLMNMGLLKIAESTDPKVFGTMLNIAEQNLRAIGASISSNLRCRVSPRLFNLTSVELLRNLKPTIMMAAS